MNFDGFIPHEFTRFGGLVDNDDPTVLPMGVAAVCRNCRFQLTTVATRYGLQTALQGPNQAGISGLAGLIYTPENPGETLFQVPMVFDTDGFLLVEKPAGSGILVRVQGPLVSQPSSAHAIITEAYNRALIAFSDLKAPLAPINVYGLSTQQLDPYGQKPLGAAWIASTSYLTGEYVQPTATGGNGHLYRCIVAGTTASAEPAWPLPENSTVTDGGVTWEEQTPVLVNRLPAPNGPQPTRMASGGAFAAGRDVYLEMTYVNAQGESIASTPSILVNTNLNDAATFTVPALSSLAGWIRGLASPYQPASVNVYEADVATSTAAPSSASFALVGNFALGSTVTVTTTAAGVAPPSANTARVTPGGLQPPPAPTVERASGSGSWAAGRDVYILASFTNAAGETLPSIAGTLIDTVVDDAIQVPIPSTLYQITGVNLYEADVPTGAAAPASSSYALVGGFQPLSTATITAPASGPPPPVVNSSGSAGNVAPGVRYASLAFTNRNGNLGPTVAAFTSVDVDVPGDQLYMANIPIGPANIINRTIGFTVADGTNVGPFFYIPAATVSAGIPMTATVIGDNSTTTAFFNFTDQFLEAETSTDMTDRLRCVLPPAAVDVYYSPSNDRVVLSGVDGYASGHYISLAADSESYYGDTSPIQVANGNGQRCICAREFQGTLFSLKERSGFTISPTATDPSTWSVQQRWEGVGPCGPRAVCVTNEFLFFVHRSGAYAYAPSEPEPKLMTKEIPTIWSTINWDYQHLIWCCVDEENKEIRIGIPVGNATVPNQTLTMNYMEGLSGPIHFSQYAGREVAMGAARKWSLDDVAGSVAVRCERRLPENASLFGALRQSQVLIGSSSPDGTVQMIATGIYNDNGSGIECQYETTSAQDLMEVSMLGGVSINALGQGSMTVSVMVARSYANSSQPSANEIKLAPFPLTPENWKGYDGGARGQNERFRMRFTNGTAPNAWFALKYCSLFTRPLFTARTGNGA
ncbi:MAG: hypothetical protein ABSC65_07145 [Acidobacteriaceae bacterium]|jgi:hypothetical protein